MAAKNHIKIASAQYPIDRLESWEAFERKIGHWLDRAGQQHCDLVLFPEYFTMELGALFLNQSKSTLQQELLGLQSLLEPFTTFFSRQARARGLHICAGTFPVQLESNAFRNRCHWFFPDGSVQFQDKLILTRFEDEDWKIGTGVQQAVFDTEFGKAGVCIGYDCEFPLLARQLVEAGAQLILVPSCTRTESGYHRVKIASQARALENQCYVVQASTVGTASWSKAVELNIGAAAIYTPVDQHFPPDGILSSGNLNMPGWVYAELAMAKLADVRKDGQTANHRDWPKQYTLAKCVPALTPV